MLIILIISRRCFTRQPENSKRAHLTAPAFENTKIQREDTQRDTKRTNFADGEGKKRNFGSPTLQDLTSRGPTLRDPFGLGATPFFGALFVWVWGPHPSGPTCLGLRTLRGPTLQAPPEGCLFFHAFFVFSSCCSFFFFEKEGQKTETPILAKVGLAKVGHPNFGQSRSIKVGQSRSFFFFGQSRSQPESFM